MIKLTVHIQYNPRQCLAYDRPLIFLSFHLLSLSEPSSPLQLWQLLHLDDAQIEIFNIGISQAPFLDLQLHGGHFSLTVYLLLNNSVSKINLMLFFLGKKKDFEKYLGVLQKVKPKNTTTRSSNFTPGYIPKRVENKYSQKNVHKCS